MPPIRVLVVDESAFFRKTLSAEIERVPGFEVVGTAADGYTAIEKVRALDPDVVTLDIEMPVMSGLDALRTITAESTAGVIVVNAQTERGAKVTIEALERGAIDFIPKTRGAAFIHEKIRAAAHARRSRQLTKVALRTFASEPSRIRPQAAAPRRDTKLVVIGSSTGGPQALLTLLRALPRGFPVPIAIAQHMPPHFTEALSKRLDENCQLRVVHASDADKLNPGTAYVAPGGSTMRIKGGAISISYTGENHLYRPSVDILTRSAVETFGKHVVGVLLTGMGADGASEMQSLNKLGGVTIAQDQATCVVYGMPKALVDSAGASEILPIEEIGGRLATLLGCTQVVSPPPLQDNPSRANLAR